MSTPLVDWKHVGYTPWNKKSDSELAGWSPPSDYGGIVIKIEVFCSRYRIRGIQMVHSDGGTQHLGSPIENRDVKKHVLDIPAGVKFKKLALLGKKSFSKKTKLKGIEIELTNGGKMKAEVWDFKGDIRHDVDVGSGLCVGMRGYHGRNKNVYSLNFSFLKEVVSVEHKIDWICAVDRKAHEEIVKVGRFENPMQSVKKDSFEYEEKTEDSSSFTHEWSDTHGFDVQVTLSGAIGPLSTKVQSTYKASFKTGESTKHAHASSRSIKMKSEFDVEPGKAKTVTVYQDSVEERFHYEGKTCYTLACGAKFNVPLKGSYVGTVRSNSRLVTEDAELS